jgi:hypothetical protein
MRQEAVWSKAQIIEKIIRVTPTLSMAKKEPSDYISSHLSITPLSSRQRSTLL